MLVSLALLAGTSPAAASAAAGFRDFAWTATSVNGPSAEKPQSKLWYNDGAWWGDLFDRSSNTWRIHRLDAATQIWSNTGTTVDDRPGTWADALWDGTHLYIASAGTSPTNGADKARLYRFSYSPSTKTYTSDGPPTTIAGYGMEAIVIDKDSTGALWATWTHNNQVYVNTGNSTNGAWGTPFVMPGSTAVDPDDISSVVSFKGNIGVMWSNQVAHAMYFGQHADGDPAPTWATRKVVDGDKLADDHINLKSLQEINGQIFATVKTSLGDIPGGDPNAPLILLLKRDAAGTWSTTTVSTVKDDQTRPIVMLNPSQDKLYVFATTPVGGGTIESGTAETAIFYKTTSMSSPSFGPGPGTPFIQTDGDLHINDATSTKQTVTAGSGVVVLASDNVSGFYMHGVIAPTTAPPDTTNPGGPTSPGDTGSTPVTQPSGPPVSGPVPVPVAVPVAPSACPADRTAVVRWSVPKHLRMSSIVVTVAGKRYAKFKGSRHSVAVRLGKQPGTFRVEIRGVARNGKVYSARRTASGCAGPGGKALRLTRAVRRT
jgi:hypothetical protein